MRCVSCVMSNEIYITTNRNELQARMGWSEEERAISRSRGCCRFVDGCWVDVWVDVWVDMWVDVWVDGGLYGMWMGI